MICRIAVRTSLGWCAAEATEVAVVRVVLPCRTKVGALAGSPASGSSALADGVARKLRRYFDGEPVEFDEPVDLSACGAFARSVLEELRSVGRGQVVSYEQLARLAGRPGAARAVGQAMAHNPVPVIVPCHRVVRSDGTLGGFGGGLALKRRMLELEGVAFDGERVAGFGGGT